jgi:hypothetical protein
MGQPRRHEPGFKPVPGYDPLSPRGRLFWCGLPGPETALAKGAGMIKQPLVVLYVVAMAVLIVSVDVAFFRNRFWERLLANVGIVLVFAAFYLRFLRP